MADEIDPWDWSQDQVIEAFCRNRELLPLPTSTSTLPDPITFEALLREHEINGSTLLTDITQEVLKTDLQVKPIGQRSAVTHAIQELRKRSQKYAQHNPRTPSHASIAGGYWTPGPNTSYSDHHFPRPDIFSPNPGQQRLQEQKNAASESGASPPFARPAIRDRPPVPDVQSPLQVNEAGSGESNAHKRRMGEAMVEEGAGRKIRRLDLSTTARSKTTNTELPASSGTTSSFVTSKTSGSPENDLDPALPSRSHLCGMQDTNVSRYHVVRPR